MPTSHTESREGTKRLPDHREMLIDVLKVQIGPVLSGRNKDRAWDVRTVTMNTRESVTIYVRLADRPEHLDAVKAVKLNGDRFRLLESSPDLEHHIWGYEEGDEVLCVEVEFAPGERGFIVEAKSTLS